MSTASEVQEALVPPLINAHFESRMPMIIEALSKALVVSRPALNEARIHIEEIHDHLDFEIKKAELEVERSEWAARSQPDKANQDRRWLAKLKAIKERFATEGVWQSVEFLENLKDELQQTFP